MTNLYRDTKEELKEQSPSLNILTKDKFGGVDTERWSLQSNKTSKTYRLSVWLENFILASSVYEGAIKLVGWLALGSMLAVTASISFWASVATVPVMWSIILMIFICRNTALKWPSYFILMIVIFGYFVSFFGA